MLNVWIAIVILFTLFAGLKVWERTEKKKLEQRQNLNYKEYEKNVSDRKDRADLFMERDKRKQAPKKTAPKKPLSEGEKTLSEKSFLRS